MYKILVLKNRIDVDIIDDCNKAIEYFKKHKIDISFDFKDSNIPITLKDYAKATNGEVYAGFEDSVKDACYDLVPKGQYHVCVLAWNTKENTTNLVPTSWTNWSPLDWRKADTEFVQLVTNDYNDKVDWIYKSIIHELVHTLCKRLNRRGLNVLDEMDISQGVPYFHNDDPDYPDGNFARTFKNLEPHLDKIYDFYFISKEKPVLDVKQLQRDLKALGYFKYPLITGVYGPVTKSAVQALQRATGLVVDGVAGTKTLQKIEELKKKPKIEVLAKLLVEKCKEQGLKIRITETYRSQQRQDELYASGRTKPGLILTNAKKSKHTEGKAFDYCFVGKDPYPTDDNLYKRVADIGKSIGLTSGYYFKSFRDRVHMEI